MLSKSVSLLRRRGCIAACAALVAAASFPVHAHHGWSWAEEGNSELTGVIVDAKLGNPHGELTLEVEGVRWIVEVGQPWRNQRAGLSDAMLAKGVKLSVFGHRHADPKRKVLKAERVFIEGRKYDLYPERD